MPDHARDEVTEGAGASADQHVTGHEGTGTFQTDLPPGTTPTDGSTNRGINARRANRQDPDAEPAG